MEFIKKKYGTINQPIYAVNTSVTVTDDTTSFSTSTTGNPVPGNGSPSANFKKRIILPSASGAVSDHSIQVSPDATSNIWMDVSNIFPHIVSGVNEYGIWYSTVSATQIDVYFGKSGATADLTWSAAYNSGNGWRWRYERSQAGTSATIVTALLESPATVNSATGNDSTLLLSENNVYKWYVSHDQSDSDAFVIGTGNTVGSNVTAKCTTAGAWTFQTATTHVFGNVSTAGITWVQSKSKDEAGSYSGFRTYRGTKYWHLLHYSDDAFYIEYNNGSTTTSHANCTLLGAWTLGPTTETPYGNCHFTYANIRSGTPSVATDLNGAWSIGANFYTTAAGSGSRRTGLSGVRLTMAPRALDTDSVFVISANQQADGDVGGDTIASATANGAWTFNANAIHAFGSPSGNAADTSVQILAGGTNQNTKLFFYPKGTGYSQLVNGTVGSTFYFTSSNASPGDRDVGWFTSVGAWSFLKTVSAEGFRATSGPVTSGYGICGSTADSYLTISGDSTQSAIVYINGSTRPTWANKISIVSAGTYFYSTSGPFWGSIIDGEWDLGPTAGFANGYHTVYGTILSNSKRVGVDNYGQISANDYMQISANLYHQNDSINTVALQSVTGFTALSINRRADTTSSVLELFANYLDAQFAGQDAIGTNAKSILFITAPGAHTIGPSGTTTYTIPHLINGTLSGGGTGTGDAQKRLGIGVNLYYAGSSGSVFVPRDYAAGTLGGAGMEFYARANNNDSVGIVFLMNRITDLNTDNAINVGCITHRGAWTIGPQDSQALTHYFGTNTGVRRTLNLTSGYTNDYPSYPITTLRNGDKIILYQDGASMAKIGVGDNSTCGHMSFCSVSNVSKAFSFYAVNGIANNLVETAIGYLSGSWLFPAGDVTVGVQKFLRARYTTDNTYSATMEWATLQLGNNGANYLVAGRTAVGGSFYFYVNNTNDASYSNSPNGTQAGIISSAGVWTLGPSTGTAVTQHIIQSYDSQPLMVKNRSSDICTVIFQGTSNYISFGSSAGQAVCGGLYGKTASGGSAVYITSGGLLGTSTSIREAKIFHGNIEDVSWIRKLNPVMYEYRKVIDGIYQEEGEGHLNFGMFYDEVKPVCPTLCFENIDGSPSGIAYERLITPLVKFSQQSADKIDTLMQEVSALKQEIAELKSLGISKAKKIPKSELTGKSRR